MVLELPTLTLVLLRKVRMILQVALLLYLLVIEDFYKTRILNLEVLKVKCKLALLLFLLKKMVIITKMTVKDQKIRMMTATLL